MLDKLDAAKEVEYLEHERAEQVANTSTPSITNIINFEAILGLFNFDPNPIF